MKLVENLCVIRVLMKPKEIRQKPEAELIKLLPNTRRKLFEARFNLESGKVKNVSEMRKLRREVARILTILKEKSNE